MTFIDFNIRPVAPLPDYRVRLIRDGITRNEYRRRFGMDDASERVFSQIEQAKALAEKLAVVSKRSFKPESKKGKILSLLQPGVSLTSRMIATLLGLSHQNVSDELRDLKEAGILHAEKRTGEATIWSLPA